MKLVVGTKGFRKSDGDILFVPFALLCFALLCFALLCFERKPSELITKHSGREGGKS